MCLMNIVIYEIYSHDQNAFGPFWLYEPPYNAVGALPSFRRCSKSRAWFVEPKSPWQTHKIPNMELAYALTRHRNRIQLPHTIRELFSISKRQADIDNWDSTLSISCLRRQLMSWTLTRSLSRVDDLLSAPTLKLNCKSSVIKSNTSSYSELGPCRLQGSAKFKQNNFP